MYKNLLIDYLFLISLIENDIMYEKSLFQDLKKTSNEILVNELNKCEIEIKNIINFYINFNSKFNNINNDKFYEKNNLNFNFNNNVWFIKNISLLSHDNYSLNDLIEKKNNFNFNNNFIIKNLNNDYYLKFFNNNYFNITKCINFIFNIDIISLLKNKKNIHIISDLNLTNLNSYKNINKNFISKFNPIKNNSNNIYIKFYKNLNYFDNLNIENNKKNSLVEDHFIIIKNLYSTEYNFKILLNFFKTNSYKEFYLKLPINYVSSNLCQNIESFYFSPSIDFYLNNLLYDKIIFNPEGDNIKNSLIFIKKKIVINPIIFNYKFKNKFNYFAHKKYNLNLNQLKNYNIDLFNVSKTKKITGERINYDSIYYSRSNLKDEVSRAAALIQYRLPRIRPFVQHRDISRNKQRQLFYDTTVGQILDFAVETYNLYSRMYFNHYLYGASKAGTPSSIHFTDLDMFFFNSDVFFFKFDTFNKQNHYISNLNKIKPGIRKFKPFNDFFWESDKEKIPFFRSNLIYDKTKYERSLNLMFNFNEVLKPNKNFINYICNLLFGFIKTDDNQTYITFKDHYNQNNFLSNNILYRFNNLNYNKNLKYNIFYKEYLDVIHRKSWQKPFDFNLKKKLPYFLHTKKESIYPNYTVWPISEDFIKSYYRRRGFGLSNRKIIRFYDSLFNNIIPFSRFLKTGLLSKSIHNKYINFLPFFNYINKFNFIKLSKNYTKRNDFISFIPKFKILSYTLFNSLEPLKYFERSNTILIKFTNNLYNINNQKIDQSNYNLNSFNNKIINYIPDSFYKKYATLEWNNKLFMNILNRKLIYKHIISFGDLSNIYIQKYIYDYIKIIFFDEKLKNVIFNRNIFKYKNFENLNDFIKYKNNKSFFNKKDIIISSNKNLNLYIDLKNIFKITINPFLHVYKHYRIFLNNYNWEGFFDLYKKMYRNNIGYLKWNIYCSTKVQDRPYDPNDFPKHYDENMKFKVRQKAKEDDYVYRIIDKLDATFPLYYANKYKFRFIRWPTSGIILKQIIIDRILGFHYNSILNKFNEYNASNQKLRNHFVGFNFFKYCWPTKYLKHISNSKLKYVNIDKLFSLVLIFNINLLNNILNYSKINFNLFHNIFFDYKIKIDDINLIKKKSINNYKLYKNNLIEEAGLYNSITTNKLIQDEDFFLLYNRKRLDNESIYKSWHSTKFLNKKIDYYSYNNLFDVEKFLYFFYNNNIWNLFRFKNFEYIYKSNYAEIPFKSYFSSDINYNRKVFRNVTGNSFSSNINFTYPQNNIKNLKITSFISFKKETIGYNNYDRYLNGSYKQYYKKKKFDIIKYRFECYDHKHGLSGLFLYGSYKDFRIKKHLRKRRIKIPEISIFEDSVIEKIKNFNTNLKSLKYITKREKKQTINRLLSFFQYYNDTRYPKQQNNLKKINFVFNLFNYQAYFVNDRYFFENKNLSSLHQFYNHRTTSDYLRNLINLRKFERFFLHKKEEKYIKYKDLTEYSNCMLQPYNKIYNSYSPIKIWEIKLSSKLFPYFYAKNLIYDYKLLETDRLLKLNNNLYYRQNTYSSRKKKNNYFEYYRYHKYFTTVQKYLNIDETNFFKSFFFKFFEINKQESPLKKKYFFTSIGNLINFEYKYNNYICKQNKDYYSFLNEKFINDFNFKLNDKIYTYSYISIYKYNNKFPNHLNPRMFFDFNSIDKKLFIIETIKFFKYCIKNNFYVKLPYIFNYTSKTLYNDFDSKNFLFFNKIDAIKDSFKLHTKNNKITEFKYFNFSFWSKKEKLSKISFDFNKILYNINNIYIINIYKGQKKYLNTSSDINKYNNYLILSKIYDFDKYIKKNDNNIFFKCFFNPYDLYIFRYKSSFTSLQNVNYKTNSNINFRNFILKFSNFNLIKSSMYDIIYNIIEMDKNLLHSDINFKSKKNYNYIKTRINNNMSYFNKIFKKKNFILKYYENLSLFNRKKIEELSLFGFLVKNNILLGIYEYNNLINLSYNLSYEKFYINNNESNIYSLNKILNTIFVLKNKYIWLIYYYYYNLFYFFFLTGDALEQFIWEPKRFWNYYFYFRIPILFFVDYKLLFFDFILTCYTIFIQILIIFYSWLCISGEGLLKLKDFIILDHNQIDWLFIIDKYNMYPCDLYGRSLFEMQISRIIYILFFLSYFIIYFIIINFLFKILKKICLFFLKKKNKHIFLDKEKKNKKNYNIFFENYINNSKNLKVIFFYKSDHSYKYYKSTFKGKLKIPYFLDEASLKRINKLKIITNFETHPYVNDVDLRKLRTTLSFLNASYALFTKTRTIEIGNLLLKGNIKRILYISQLGNVMTYDPILLNSLTKKNFNKDNFFFIDKLFLNNQLKIFNLMPLSENKDYIYMPQSIFKTLIKYRFKYINTYYTYNFLFFFTFDSLLTIEGTLFKISNPNFFKPLLFFNQNISPRIFSFFL